MLEDDDNEDVPTSRSASKSENVRRQSDDEPSRFQVDAVVDVRPLLLWLVKYRFGTFRKGNVFLKAVRILVVVLWWLSVLQRPFVSSTEPFPYGLKEPIRLRFNNCDIGRKDEIMERDRHGGCCVNVPRLVVLIDVVQVDILICLGTGRVVVTTADNLDKACCRWYRMMEAR